MKCVLCHDSRALLCLGYFQLISTWSGCLILPTNIRENSRGENRIMTIAPFLFCVVWHEKCLTKKKWLYFGLPRFSVLVLVVGHYEKSSSIYVSTVEHAGSLLIDRQVKSQRWIQIRWYVAQGSATCQNVAPRGGTQLGATLSLLPLYKTDLSFLSPPNSIFPDLKLFLYIFLFFSCSNLSIWRSICPSVCSNASSK